VVAIYVVLGVYGNLHGSWLLRSKRETYAQEAKGKVKGKGRRIRKSKPIEVSQLLNDFDIV
jgi:hypothetical protein